MFSLRTTEILNYSAEQVLSLAPDESSAKAGRGLGSPSKWALLQRTDSAIWGECQGSGKDPYRVECDLSEPAFKCTCPSRKFPCKHGIGLLLVLAQKPAAFSNAEPPAWVAEWLEKRAVNAEKKSAKAEAAAEPADPETEAKKAAAREKRAASREENVKSGAAELELWLRDVVRQGLGAAQQQPVSFWENTARRMVDAQAPGLARRVRECGSLISSSEGWSHRVLARLGSLFLLTQATGRIETLPPALTEDVRTALGFTFREEDVLAQSSISDVWQVQGEVIEEEDRLRVRRAWLRGLESGRTALLLNFSAAGKPFDLSIVAGSEFRGELSFFPSAFPLRALVKKKDANLPISKMDGFPTIAPALDAAAEAYAANPWIEQFPMSLKDVLPVESNGRWALADSTGQAIPVSPRFAAGWDIFAFSGGYPISVFGEWNGYELSPLGAHGNNGRYLNLKPSLLV